MLEKVKIPKKLAEICALVRDGQNDGIEKLSAYPGLDRQKAAVLAEVAYFDGDFEKALQIDMTLCPYWDEWYYSNVRTEHTGAMSFVARLLGRQDEIIGFFEEQISLDERDNDIPAHIKKAKKNNYENRIEYLRTGVVPHFTEKEIYTPLETPVLLDELRAAVIKENKKLDVDSKEWLFALFKKVCSKGTLEDMFVLYEKIAENNLSTMWHIKALMRYNHIGNTEKAFEIVLRMARQRLWAVASDTQVRPMEFFTHPSIFGFLNDKSNLDKIAQAAMRG